VAPQSEVSADYIAVWPLGNRGRPFDQLCMETYYGAQAPSKAKAPDFPEAFELIRTMADG